jgi:hypothetical protein
MIDMNRDEKRHHGPDLLRLVAILSGCLVVIGMTIILTFIISVVGYYILIKITALSWVVNGYRNSSLQLSFIPARDGKGQG